MIAKQVGFEHLQGAYKTLLFCFNKGDCFVASHLAMTTMEVIAMEVTASDQRERGNLSFFIARLNGNEAVALSFIGCHRERSVAISLLFRTTRLLRHCVPRNDGIGRSTGKNTKPKSGIVFGG
ncbi:MAG: hypothetical protein AB1552_10610 [Nitrospirota bacterium]